MPKFNFISWLLNIGILLLSSALYAQVDPLPSWNEGPTKNAILQFVQTTTDKNSTHFVAPKERIATFDQDGTLWVEQPQYPQWYFTIDHLKSLATTPFSKFNKLLKALFKKVEILGQVPKQELTAILGLIDTGISVDSFRQSVNTWLNTAEHPDFHKPFTSLIYQPMLELIELLQANEFKTYIVSGGGQEFIRVYAEEVYQIPPEQIIGSAIQVKYENEDGRIVFKRTPDILFVNDKEGKAESIHLMIGRHPIAAFGNSDGDRQMLELTWANKGFALLVHHDDEKREYAYDKDSSVGKLTDAFMQEAKERSYTIVSIKNDWKILFPWQK